MDLERWKKAKKEKTSGIRKDTIYCTYFKKIKLNVVESAVFLL